MEGWHTDEGITQWSPIELSFEGPFREYNETLVYTLQAIGHIDKTTGAPCLDATGKHRKMLLDFKSQLMSRVTTSFEYISIGTVFNLAVRVGYTLMKRPKKFLRKPWKSIIKSVRGSKRAKIQD